MKALTKNQQANALGDWISSIPGEFLHCRDLRHQWTGAMHTWRLGHGFRGRSLNCLRCGVQKEQVIDKTGKVVVSRMLGYPDDYKKPADAPKGRVPIEAIRAESIDRSLEAGGSAPAGLTAIFDRMTKRSK